MLFQQLVNGITIGGIYALIALGYSMVYGILGIVNFAHADIMMFGTFIGLMLAEALNLPIIVVFIVASICTAVIGMLVELVAYRPIKSDNRRMSVLVSALGMSIFIQNLALVIWGTGTHTFSSGIEIKAYTIGSIVVSNVQIMIMIVTMVMLLVLYTVVYKTQLGVAMRACSVSVDYAKLLGINSNGIISLTFGIGTFMAAIAGICVGIYYDAVYPTMGYMLGMKAFAAAILGGIGSIPGAVIGGFSIGIIETLGATYISSGYRDAYAFIIMVLILVIRPSGLFGAKQIDKV